LNENATEVRSFAIPFPSHSPRPFVSSGCLPPDYLRALEAAERQGDISDYPQKLEFWRVEGSDDDFDQNEELLVTSPRSHSRYNFDNWR
jgi:hypothetical protein